MRKYIKNEEFDIMTRQQVRGVDRWAIDQMGISGVVLMENAGRSCSELIINNLSGISEPNVCVFCGTGNNGGDGYVIARHLFNNGFNVTVIICGDKNKVKGDAKINLDIWEKMGKTVHLLDMEQDNIAKEVEQFACDKDMLVDCIFGTGLKGELTGSYRQLVESINAQHKCILAVDIPSGLDCDFGQPLGASIQADYTVTFVAVKKGFTIDEAQKYTGEVFVSDIGIIK